MVHRAPGAHIAVIQVPDPDPLLGKTEQLVLIHGLLPGQQFHEIGHRIKAVVLGAGVPLLHKKAAEGKVLVQRLHQPLTAGKKRRRLLGAGAAQTGSRDGKIHRRACNDCNLLLLPFRGGEEYMEKVCRVLLCADGEIQILGKTGLRPGHTARLGHQEKPACRFPHGPDAVGAG